MLEGLGMGQGWASLEEQCEILSGAQEEIGGTRGMHGKAAELVSNGVLLASESVWGLSTDVPLLLSLLQC